MTLQECNSAEEKKGERHGKQSILTKELKCIRNASNATYFKYVAENIRSGVGPALSSEAHAYSLYLASGPELEK